MRHLTCLPLLAAALLAGACATEDEGDLGAGHGLLDDGGTDDLGDGKADGVGNRTCALGSTLRGIDVSKYQGTIDWPRVKGDGISFAFIRVSDGTGALDPTFRANWAASKSAGVVRGVYQFFRPSQDPIAQADKLIAAVGALEPQDMPPVIDVEVTGNVAPAEMRVRVQKWIDRVERGLGRRPIIYSGAFFWRDSVGGGAAFEKHPLWIAQYTSLCPRLPSPWRRWTFWQTSATGRVAGITGDVDLNRFDGNRAVLDQMIAASNLGGKPPERGPDEQHDRIDELDPYGR